jgi:SAM-dependent methyltransferase
MANESKVASPRPLTRAWLVEGLAWRWKFLIKRPLARMLGVRDQQWLRAVCDQKTEEFVRSLDYRNLDAVELSPGGDKWAHFGFRSYRPSNYEECDICERPLAPAAFDVVIAEHVLEHVLWPFRAVRHVYQMLRPGGWFLVATPFMYRVHDYPVDCSRWTERGMKHLLMEGGFPEEGIRTGSWGNRACIKANFRRIPSYIPWWHSLRNEPEFPVVVWAFAQKL